MKDRDPRLSTDEKPVHTARRPLDRRDQITIMGLAGTAMLLLVAVLVVRQISGRPLLPRDSVDPVSISFQVDINTAPWTEIAVLPGIGEHLARNIVEYRETCGSISSVEQLATIHGIGDATIDQIAPYVALPRNSSADSEMARSSVTITR